MIYSI